MNSARPARICFSAILLIGLLMACYWFSPALAADASLPSPGPDNASDLAAGPNVLWTKTFGGDRDDWGNCLMMTADGGYIIVVGTQSFGSQGTNVYLIKADADGIGRWERTYGGAGDDEAFGVVPTRDGGYAITGYTRSQGSGGSDVYLIKTDASGAVQREKTYGTDKDDGGYAILELADGPHRRVHRLVPDGRHRRLPGPDRCQRQLALE
jgi:hypothetical protein